MGTHAHTAIHTHLHQIKLNSHSFMVQMSHVTLMNVRTEAVVSHRWMSHVTHMNEYYLVSGHPQQSCFDARMQQESSKRRPCCQELDHGVSVMEQIIAESLSDFPAYVSECVCECEEVDDTACSDIWQSRDTALQLHLYKWEALPAVTFLCARAMHWTDRLAEWVMRTERSTLIRIYTTTPALRCPKEMLERHGTGHVNIQHCLRNIP